LLQITGIASGTVQTVPFTSKTAVTPHGILTISITIIDQTPSGNLMRIWIQTPKLIKCSAGKNQQNNCENTHGRAEAEKCGQPLMSLGVHFENKIIKWMAKKASRSVRRTYECAIGS
jgi:hypothetical protein